MARRHSLEPESSARHEIAGLAASDHALQVSWRDGHGSRFPSVWLLQACACPRCGATESAVRLTTLTDHPARPRIAAAVLREGAVEVDWGGGHVSCFSPSWLRGHCLSPEERARRKPVPRLWGREMADRLPRMAYPAVAGNAGLHLTFLETLRDLGFVILQGVPKERSRTEEVASLVGKLRLTNYGIFELESKAEPEIVGDMSVALQPHTDEPYRIEPPAITLFHVLAQAEVGGDSTLTDGFRLAEVFRDRDPEAFELLSTRPARFHRVLKEGRAFDISAPIISRDRDGAVTGLRLLDRGMAPVDLPPAEVEPFYDALRSFLALLYGGEGRITVKLQAGEMLVFNNQRLLHGRTAFDAASRRHVRSCHVDLDEFHSRLRVAYRALGREEAWMALGPGVRA